MTNWPVQTQTHRTEQTHSGHKDATNIKKSIFGFFYFYSLCLFSLFSIHSAWYVDAEEMCATPSDIALIIDGSRSIWPLHFDLQVGLASPTVNYPK